MDTTLLFVCDGLGLEEAAIMQAVESAPTGHLLQAAQKLLAEVSSSHKNGMPQYVSAEKPALAQLLLKEVERRHKEKNRTFRKPVIASTATAAATPGEMLALVKEAQKSARDAYLKVHTVKHEMDNWGSHEGKADFTKPQSKVYKNVMDTADKLSDAIDAAEQLLQNMRKAVASTTAVASDEELAVEVQKLLKVRKSVDSYYQLMEQKLLQDQAWSLAAYFIVNVYYAKRLDKVPESVKKAAKKVTEADWEKYESKYQKDIDRHNQKLSDSYGRD
jgi:hypothetical protein